MVVVVGLNGGSNRLATGGNSRHGSVPSVLPKPPAPGVGTSIPVARKGSCETGLSRGMVLLVSSATISRLGRMFMVRPYRRALAFLGFWVQRLLSQRGNRHRVTGDVDRRNRVAP